MTATDILRRLLDERGVEWRRTPHYSSESQDNETVFEGNGIEWYANDHLNGRLGLRAVRYEVTPEQAIDATLGVTDATGERHGGAGTLTADDVRDLIERHSDASGGNGRIFHNGAYRAIADELNATLGRGTCHFEQIPEALYDDIECSECGVALWGFQMDIVGEGCPTRPRYCPNCGRKVV